MKKIKRRLSELRWAIAEISNPFTYLWSRLHPFRQKDVFIHFRNGIRYLLPKPVGDAAMIREIWMDAPYDAFPIEDNFTIVDIGANIGIFSIKASKAAKNVRVLAFEPVPSNVEAIKENAKLNDCAIETFPFAVGAENGTVKMYVYPKNKEASIHASAESEMIEFPSISLNKALEGIERCDFMKMDCEGSEEAILLNCPLNILRKIRSMAVEWHDKYSTFGLEYFIKSLSNNGYEVKYDSKNHIVNAVRIGRIARLNDLH